MRGFIIVAWAQFFLLTGYATYYSLAPSPGDTFDLFWDKALHFICWFVLLMSLKLPWILRPKLWLGALVLFAYSILIEVLQFLMPPREFSAFDIIANASGIISALALLYVANPLFERWIIPLLLHLLRNRQVKTDS